VCSANVSEGGGTTNEYTYLWVLAFHMKVVKLEVSVMLMHSTKEPQDFYDYFKCKQNFKVNFINIKSVW
jgi:hypothetical protein